MTLAVAAHPEARVEFLGAVDAVAAYAGLEDEFLAEAARVSALVTAAPHSFPVDLASPNTTAIETITEAPIAPGREARRGRASTALAKADSGPRS